MRLCFFSLSKYLRGKYYTMLFGISPPPDLRVFNIAGIPVALIIPPTLANSILEVEIAQIGEIPVCSEASFFFLSNGSEWVGLGQVVPFIKEPLFSSAIID